MPKEIFIILSGGPGIYDPNDPEHDASWANYASPPLLRTLPIEPTEEVHWLVYEPAYTARWNSDRSSRRTAPSQYEDTLEVLHDKKGRVFKDYLDKLKRGAQDHKWTYKGISSAQDFWDYISRLKGQRLSRLWYYGHAREDLWLTVEHDSTHEAVEPGASAVVRLSDIKTGIRPFTCIRRDKKRPYKLYGCNTRAFAMTLATHLSVYTEGCEGQVDYRYIYDTGGFVKLSRSSRWYRYDYKGSKTLSTLKAGDNVD